MPEAVNICPCCGSHIRVYRVNFSPLHARILMKIRAYCLYNNLNEFDIKALDKELNLTKSEYATVNVLCRFGLLYRIEDEGKKVKGGHYGMPFTRTDLFLKNQGTVAKYYDRDVQKKTHILSEERIFFRDVKGAFELLKNNLPNFVEYL